MLEELFVKNKSIANIMMYITIINHIFALLTFPKKCNPFVLKGFTTNIGIHVTIFIFSFVMFFNSLSQLIYKSNVDYYTNLSGMILCILYMMTVVFGFGLKQQTTEQHQNTNSNRLSTFMSIMVTTLQINIIVYASQNILNTNLYTNENVVKQSSRSRNYDNWYIN